MYCHNFWHYFTTVKTSTGIKENPGIKAQFHSKSDSSVVKNVQIKTDLIGLYYL